MRLVCVESLLQQYLGTLLLGADVKLTVKAKES